MALLAVHHWDSQQEHGVRELRRVARGPIVILTFDPRVSARMWLMAEYLPRGCGTRPAYSCAPLVVRKPIARALPSRKAGANAVALPVHVTWAAVDSDISGGVDPGVARIGQPVEQL